MIKDLSFGAIFRSIRLRNKETLRQYCIKRGLDSGNMSKLERNMLSPPLTKKQLDQYLDGMSYTELEYNFLLTAAFNHQIAMARKRLELDSEEEDKNGGV